MTPALVLLGYATVVGFLLPPVLARLTGRGVGARAGLVAWLVAMACVLAATGGALSFLIEPLLADWPAGAVHAFHGSAVEPCTAVANRLLVFGVCTGMVAVAAAAATAAFTFRYARALHRVHRRTRTHAQVARMAGHPLADVDTVVVDSPRAAAYCLPGRPPTIVVTRAALAALEPAQLRAVLAHERAHLAGRHHLLVALTRGLATLLPIVPLFRHGAQQVVLLTEMCADDVAARRVTRHSLVAALLTMGMGTPVPDTAVGTVLAATGAGVTSRVHRLLQPSTGADRTRVHAALTAVTLVIVLALAFATAVAVSLTGCGTAS